MWSLSPPAWCSGQLALISGACGVLSLASFGWVRQLVRPDRRRRVGWLLCISAGVELMISGTALRNELDLLAFLSSDEGTRARCAKVVVASGLLAALCPWFHEMFCHSSHVYVDVWHHAVSGVAIRVLFDPHPRQNLDKVFLLKVQWPLLPAGGHDYPQGPVKYGSWVLHGIEGHWNCPVLGREVRITRQGKALFWAESDLLGGSTYDDEAGDDAAWQAPDGPSEELSGPILQLYARMPGGELRAVEVPAEASVAQLVRAARAAVGYRCSVHFDGKEISRTPDALLADLGISAQAAVEVQEPRGLLISAHDSSEMEVPLELVDAFRARGNTRGAGPPYYVRRPGGGAVWVRLLDQRLFVLYVADESGEEGLGRALATGRSSAGSTSTSSSTAGNSGWASRARVPTGLESCPFKLPPGVTLLAIRPGKEAHSRRQLEQLVVRWPQGGAVQPRISAFTEPRSDRESTLKKWVKYSASQLPAGYDTEAEGG
eukprot:TRINITY_DN51746_c0_g1_i1.p1 TRINITY_DN51746_c0_g1~~TRINITY_DN51746_c0_g1_i1.p1  ORF type:complete len:519 (+),score=106.51 TRINITY_DN51746_c0_g1_i1:96-1559(+)